MSARERELRARHAQLVAQLERERAALAESLRDLPTLPRLASTALRSELQSHWPMLAARLGQLLGTALLARRAASLPAFGWLPLVLELLRWRRVRANGAVTASPHAGPTRVVLATAVVGLAAAALWRARRSNANGEGLSPP